jgi:hypothetical protein
MTYQMNLNEKTRWYLIVFGMLYSLFALIMVFWGRLHVDEGYYHLIAALTGEGRIPYRDYIYVQTPLYPFIYGLLFNLFGGTFVAARIYSVLFGFSAFLLAVVSSRKIGGVSAAFVTATLILFQPFTVYYLTIVKLYAVTGFILVVLVYVLTSRLSSVWRYSIASGLAAIAISIRLTVLPVLPMVLIIAALRTKGVERVKTVSASVLVGSGVLAMAMIPFQMLAPETFYYSILGYHLDKEGFSLFRQILHRFDTLVRLSRLYSLLGLIGAASLYVRLTHRLKHGSGRILDKWPSGVVDAGWVIGGVVGFHFVSQVPYVHRYLAMTVPAVAVIVSQEAVRLAKLSDNRNVTGGYTWIMICIIMFVAMGKPSIEFTAPNPVAQLKTIATEIQYLTGPEDDILSFNNSIAVEAGRNVLPGFEMNVLTYDPDWTREKCEMFNVLNVEMLLEALEKGVPRAVLITGNTFIGNFPTFYNPGEIGARPAVFYTLEKHYHRIRTFPGFGFMGEDAELYLPLHKEPADRRNDFDSRPAIHIYRYDDND